MDYIWFHGEVIVEKLTDKSPLFLRNCTWDFHLIRTSLRSNIFLSHWIFFFSLLVSKFKNEHRFSNQIIGEKYTLILNEFAPFHNLSLLRIRLTPHTWNVKRTHPRSIPWTTRTHDHHQTQSLRCKLWEPETKI